MPKPGNPHDRPDHILNEEPEPLPAEAGSLQDVVSGSACRCSFT